jgi:hypothetical protein
VDSRNFEAMLQNGSLQRQGTMNVMGQLLEQVRDHLTGKSGAYPTTLVIGDSQVQRMRQMWQHQIPHTKFLEWGGGDIDRIFRLALACWNPTCSTMIIAVGSNDVEDPNRPQRLPTINEPRGRRWANSPKAIAEKFRKGLTNLLNVYHQAEIVLVEIPPRFDISQDSRINEVIRITNRIIAEIVLEPAFEYNVSIAETSGVLTLPDHFEHDGLHISPRGLKRIQPIIAKFISPNLSQLAYDRKP